MCVILPGEASEVSLLFSAGASPWLIPTVNFSDLVVIAVFNRLEFPEEQLHTVEIHGVQLVDLQDAFQNQRRLKMLPHAPAGAFTVSDLPEPLVVAFEADAFCLQEAKAPGRGPDPPPGTGQSQSTASSLDEATKLPNERIGVPVADLTTGKMRMSHPDGCPRKAARSLPSTHFRKMSPCTAHW